VLRLGDQPSLAIGLVMIAAGLAGALLLLRGKEGRQTLTWFAGESHPKLPWVTILLLTINLTVFILTAQAEALLETFGLKGISLESGSFWQIITAAFLHFDAMHLLLNEYGLFVLGAPVERMFGGTKTAYLYISTGIIGNVASYFILPTYVLTLGASGAVFGLMGADLAMTAVHRTRPTGRDVGATLAYVVINFVQSMGPQINVVAHLAGLCFGLFAGLILAKYSGDVR